MNILAVDDDPVFLSLLLDILAGEGHQAATASDGEEGWERFQTADYDLVLCDWMMPRLSGPSLCRRLRQMAREHYPYVILITTESGRTHYLEGMDAGADDFLAKPVDVELLIARLRVAQRILGLHHRVQRLEGMLRICCYCKRINEGEDTWTGMESYISRRSEATFSHGICEACYQTHVLPQLEGT
ncbi:MAG TPA: response regulator transcription factor [Candidatus Xenobia bacterium]